MSTGYCLEKGELRKAQAELLFAKQLGLIHDADFEAQERRRVALNEENKEKVRKKEPVYGLISYSKPAYLQYELTRIKLDFVEETDKIKKHYVYRDISEEEKRRFYTENRDLFTRYLGDPFTYEEVEMIIVKRIREAEYENQIKNILYQLPEWE